MSTRQADELPRHDDPLDLTGSFHDVHGFGVALKLFDEVVPRTRHLAKNFEAEPRGLL